MQNPSTNVNLTNIKLVPVSSRPRTCDDGDPGAYSAPGPARLCSSPYKTQGRSEGITLTIAIMLTNIDR